MRKLVSGLLSLFVLGWAFAIPAYAETKQTTQTPPRSPAVQDRADMGIGVTGTGLPADNLRRDTLRTENYRNDMFRNDNGNDNFRTNATNTGRFRAAAENDMDWGWLGLLGLIGLAGLRGRDRERT